MEKLQKLEKLEYNYRQFLSRKYRARYSDSNKEVCKQNKMILAMTLSIIKDQIYLRHSLKKSMQMEQTFHAKINDLTTMKKGN